MYLPSKKTSPYLSSPNLLKSWMQRSGQHWGWNNLLRPPPEDGFCNLHAGSRTAFSKSLRMEVSSRSTRSQVKEDIQNNTNNKNTTMILDSRSFGVKKLNKSLCILTVVTCIVTWMIIKNHTKSKSHGISRLNIFWRHD